MIGTLLGRYRLESVLGGGWRSAVFRAEHVRLGTPAAVKVLSPELGGDPAFRERFLRDVLRAAELDHPGVVPILDADVHGDAPYVVMRLVPGGDLKTVLARHGAQEPERVAALLAQVAGALDAAHAAGLVHGDVRPSNVLLDGDRALLGDFGMAGAVPHVSAGQNGTPLDRFDYLAPEQAVGEPATPRSDVFGLGCVLYHAVTGRVPFIAGLGQGAEPPSRVRPGLPPGIDAPLLRALANDPEERFASCGELVEAVREGAHEGAPEREASRPQERSQPVAAAPPSPPPREASRPAPPPPPPPPAPAPWPAAASEPAPARPRRRPRARTAVALGAAALAAVAGYAASGLVGGSGDDEGTTGVGSRSPAPAPRGAGLAAIAARDLPDLRCTIDAATTGAAVVEHATCTPTGGAARQIRRVVLTRLSDKQGLDRLFADARALSRDPAARRSGDCRPDLPWGGTGRWFRDADLTVAGGRMFCSTGDEGVAGRPRIVWTVDDPLVLAEATADSSADLGAWWARERNLSRG